MIGLLHILWQKKKETKTGNWNADFFADFRSLMNGKKQKAMNKECVLLRLNRT